MFVLNEGQNGLKEDEGNLVSVLHSINEPRIAAADRPAELTKAFVCTVATGKDELQSHIVLYLTASGLRVMYSWDTEGFDPSLQEEVEMEALDFVENMGFMMDNLNISKLSDDKRNQLLEGLPIYEGSSAVSIPVVEDAAEPDIPDLNVERDPGDAEEVFELDALLGEDEDLLELEAEGDVVEDPVQPTQAQQKESSGALSLDSLDEFPELEAFEDMKAPEETSDSVAKLSELEAEFSRNGSDFEGELDDMVSSIDLPEPSSPEMPVQAAEPVKSLSDIPFDPVDAPPLVEPQAQKDQVKVLVRLLASL